MTPDVCFFLEKELEKFQSMQDVLRAAIVSAALILGLLVGFPLGSLSRNLFVSPHSKHSEQIYGYGYSQRSHPT